MAEAAAGRRGRGVQSIVAFLLTFVLALTIGSLLLPSSRPKARHAPPPPRAPVATFIDFIPSLPSVVVPALDDISRRYKMAWQAVTSGRFADAERAYLQILIRDPHDQKAMQALVTVQRLAANQDPGVLRGQVSRFRRAIAGEGDADDRYTHQEMALLAEATDSAVREIAAERSLQLSAVPIPSAGRDLASSSRAPGGTPSLARDALAGVRNRIIRVASSLGVLPPALDPPLLRPASGAPARPPTATRPGTSTGTAVYPLSQPTQSGSGRVSAVGTPTSGSAADAIPTAGSPSGPGRSSTSPAGPSAPDPAGGKSGGSPASTPRKESGQEGGTGGGGSGSGAGGVGSGGSGASTEASSGSGGGQNVSGGGTGASGGGGTGSGGGAGASGGGGTGSGGGNGGTGGAKDGKAGKGETDDKGDKGKGEKGDKGDKGKGKD